MNNLLAVSDGRGAYELDVSSYIGPTNIVIDDVVYAGSCVGCPRRDGRMAVYAEVGHLLVECIKGDKWICIYPSFHLDGGVYTCYGCITVSVESLDKYVIKMSGSGDRIATVTIVT